VSVPIGEASGLLLSSNQVSQKHAPVFLADGRDGPDLLGLNDAIQPIAELCAHRDTPTPLMIGIVGPSGSGKSFALERLRIAVESLTDESRPGGGSYVARLVTVPIDAAAVSGDIVSAIAAATFTALSRGKPGVNYESLADEAAHAGADPYQAANKAVERHEDSRRRLDAERQARDELEARRARLVENVLFETAGSRIDAYARGRRGQIEARLRRFDLAEGDSTANFKGLVRDLADAGWGSRIGVVLGALWSYRSQRRLLLAAALLFALAFGMAELHAPGAVDWLRGLGSPFNFAADWLSAHGVLVDDAEAALGALGALALLINVWRALFFAAMLFRSARLLGLDIQERRRDLDAASARLNRRIVALSAETEAAARLAEAAERRANSRGEAMLTRGPAPPFMEPAPAGPQAARAFLAAVGRLIAAKREPDPFASSPAMLSTRPILGPLDAVASSPAVASPDRLLLVVDNLDGMGPAQAFNLIEIVHSLISQSFVVALACDPTALAPAVGGVEALRSRLDGLFQVTFNARAAGDSERARLIARLTGAEAPRASEPTMAASRSPLADPLTESESRLLGALAPLAAATPRDAKRFLNAYRLARGGTTHRPALALMLAVAQSGDKAAVAGMDLLLAAQEGTLAEPPGPPALLDAVRATRAASGGAITLAEAIAARRLAARHQLFG
jgi:hypothetical protein